MKEQEEREQKEREKKQKEEEKNPRIVTEKRNVAARALRQIGSDDDEEEEEKEFGLKDIVDASKKKKINANTEKQLGART